MISDAFSIVNGQFYDLGANTPNPDYQGAFLGLFDAATGQIRLGGQQTTSESDGSSVLGSSLRYRIYLTSAGPGGSFATLGEPLQHSFPGAVKQWGTSVAGSNTVDRTVTLSLAGLAPGTYTLEISSFAITNAIGAPRQVENDNGGSHYQASFIVVPEPSWFGLLAVPSLVAAALLVRGRRRKDRA